MMENKLKTAPNHAVQTFITYGNQTGNRNAKNERLQQLTATLASQGIYPGAKALRVLDKILYDLTFNGIVKVRREYLSKKLNVGLNTISTAFNYLAHSKLFILSRNKSGKTNSGCRVIVDIQHVNFDSILTEVYHLTDHEKAIVKKAFPYPIKPQSKHQDSSENAVASTLNAQNPTPNHLNKNTSLKDIKTSTTQSSPKRNTLYKRLKNLYQARTGSLDGFKSYTNVLYGSMKKIKAEGTPTLSHVQLETILYQSLDAAISASDAYVKKNRFALLTAIIKNKIKDLTVANTQATKNATARKVEKVPEWFATRNQKVAEPTDEEKLFFAKEHKRILAKLKVVQ